MNFTGNYHELDLQAAYNAGLRAAAKKVYGNPFWTYQLPLKEAYDRGYSDGLKG